MIFTPQKHLQEFVNPTRYCDSDSSEIIAKSAILAEGSNTDEEAARAVFNFVRDTFKFGLTPVTQKASETLKGSIGWCVTKTNLQIAMLRALGIPARFHQVVLTKKVLKGIVSKIAYMTIKEPIWYHPWCECFIHDKWVASDLYIDMDTYRAAIKSGLISSSHISTLDWDGKNDLILVNQWMIEDRGTLTSYDQVIDQVAKEFAGIPSFIIQMLTNHSNRFTSRLRKAHA